MAVTCPACKATSSGFESHCGVCGEPLPLHSDPKTGETTVVLGSQEGAEALLPPGERVGRFKISGLLGRGGMGVVYRASDPELQRDVAIKFLSMEMSQDPMGKERFQREARAAAQLDCASIGTVYEVGEHRGRAWIAMAYYEGESLAERIAREALTPTEAQAVLRQLVEALHTAHQAGIVHRDVKPANILLAEGSRVKLVDFGLAKINTAPALTRSNQMPGTLAYMAPEQFLGGTVDHRADIWALGIVVAEMVTGNLPFERARGFGMIRNILESEPALDGLPDDFLGVVRRCLAKDPEERYQDLEELEADLWGEGTPSTETVTGGTLRRRDWGASLDRRTLWGACLAGLGVVGLVAALFLGGGWGQEPDAKPRRLIAVAPIQVLPSEAEATSTELSKAAVQIAVLRLLTALDGLLVLPPDQLLGVAGTPSEQACRVGALEVLISELSCRQARCRFEASLRSACDGTLRWTEGAWFPLGDQRLAARTVIANVRRAFSEYAVKGNVLEFDIDAEDYRELVLLWNAFETRSMSFEELLERLAALRQKAPTVVETYLLESQVAQVYFFDSREKALIDRGLGLAAQAKEMAPWDLQPVLRQFDFALAGQRPEEAEEIFRELDQKWPGEASVLQREAQLAEQKGNHELALERMLAAVELVPSWQRLQVLANMEFRQGLYDQARQHLERLLEISPGNYSGLRLLAQLELMVGSTERAEELYGQLVEGAKPESADLMMQGTARLLLRRYVPARESFQHALEEQPHPGTLLQLADCEYLLGNYAEAQRLYGQVLTQLRDDPAAESWGMLLVKAQALAHLGRPGDAVEAAQMALSKLPKSPQVAYEVSLVYTLVGDKTSALLNARKALEGGYDSRWFDIEWFDPLRQESEFQALLARGAEPSDQPPP